MQFGHHPEPARDFCAEVESIEAEIAKRAAGLPPTMDLGTRIERAMQFRSGGDAAAVVAKATLRQIAAAFKAGRAHGEPAIPAGGAARESVNTRYDAARIAWELERTALGDGHYGNALRAAKDIPGLSDDDRAVLDRYATGLNGGTDHVRLQDVALRIARAAVAKTPAHATQPTEIAPGAETFDANELANRLESIRAGIDAQHRVRNRTQCVGCNRWNPIGHPEAHGHADDCPEIARVREESNTRKRLDAVIAELRTCSHGV